MIIDKELLNKIKKRTITDYGFEIGKDKVFLEQNDIYAIIEDLLLEIANFEEKYEDLERNLEDNYRKISVEEQI